MENIKKSEAMILRDIALNGPATGYTISKRTDLSNKTVYTTLKDLVNGKSLSVSVVGKTRAKQDMKEYSLTVFGLIYVLFSTRPEEWQSIMKAWPSLIPLVTDRWDFFVDAGVEDLAMGRFRTASREMFILTLDETPIEAIDLMSSIDFFSTSFYKSRIRTYDPEGRLRWLETCRTDQDVCEYFIRCLNIDIYSHATQIVEDEKMLNILEDNKGKRKSILSEDIMRRLFLYDDGTTVSFSSIDRSFDKSAPSSP